jgi:hypothetical protein
VTYDPFDPFDPFEDQPMYFDFFLRFDTEAEANAALFDSCDIVDGDVVETVLVPKYAAVDVIGVLYAPTGKTIHNEELSYAEMAPIDGWHVNVRHTAEAPELDAYKVDVKTPARMWA